MGACLHFPSHKELTGPQGPRKLDGSESYRGTVPFHTNNVRRLPFPGFVVIVSTVLICHLLLGHGSGFVTSQGVSTNKSGLVGKPAGILKASRGTLCVFLRVN